jgi:hypothetical protein
METDIKFTTTNSFSIRCGKCADIHNAQLDGKTSNPCECGCHEKYTPTYTPIQEPCCPQFPPYPTWTGTGDGIPNRGYTTCNWNNNDNLKERVACF